MTPILNISRKYDRDILREVVTLRQRNRVNAMRLTQRAALPLFVERGFDEVTVNEIAAAVGMAPSTLYRHFSTKEDIVLWDEHDVAIDDALARGLARHPPLTAMRDVFIHVLGTRYDADLEFQLRRVKFIYEAEQLHSAAVEADLRARAELAAGIQPFMKRKNRPSAEILAGAALLVLDVAIDRWQRDDAKTPLAKLIADGFSDLERLGELR